MKLQLDVRKGRKCDYVPQIADRPGGSDRSNDIGLSEILSFEQQRLSAELRQRVGEAITEIQSRGVAALSKIVKRLSGKMRLFNRERFYENCGPTQKHVALAKRIRSERVVRFARMDGPPLCDRVVGPTNPFETFT